MVATKNFIRDVGPITFCELPMPEKGGLILLKSSNGQGKSIALDAIESALTRNGTVDARDDQAKGQVEFAGATISVGISTRRTGTAEVYSLSGKYCVSDLVSPGIADPVAADAKRIKVLLALTGAQANPTLWHPLVKDIGEFDKLIKPDTIETTDLLQQAARVKRDLDQAARDNEGLAENATGRAESARKTADGVHLIGESNSAVLAALVEEKVRALAALEAEANAAMAKGRSVLQAQTKLKSALADYKGPTAAEADELRLKADSIWERAKEATAKAKAVLAKAEADERTALADWKHATSQWELASQHEKLTAQWQTQIEADTTELIPKERINEAQAAVDQARQDLERGVTIRAAKAAILEAEKFSKLAIEHADRAERLRAAAKGTDEILSGLIAKSGVPLKVATFDRRQRLIFDTKKRSLGKVPYGDLSHGERTKIAIDIYIDAIKKSGGKGVLILSQENTEALDSANLRSVYDQAIAAGVVVYGAKADEGELRAEIYKP